MAKQMSYTSKDGTTHEESYWRVAVIILEPKKQAHIIAQGYHDQNAREQGAEPIGQADYYALGEDMNSFFGSTKQNQQGQNPQKAAYAFIDTFETPGEGEEVSPRACPDSNGPSGFFDGSTDV